MKRIKTKNRMKPMIWAGALLLAAPLHAQPSVDAVLDAVERNNTTLKALRQEAEAQKLGNRTGLLHILCGSFCFQGMADYFYELTGS